MKNMRVLAPPVAIDSRRSPTHSATKQSTAGALKVMRWCVRGLDSFGMGPPNVMAKL